VRALILGGTAEARELAQALDAAGVAVTTSLAGRVGEPERRAGETRIGGFGGASGLRRWVADHGIDVVVDATHPFAQRISAAAEHAGVPLIRLERPGWPVDPNWTMVADVRAAAPHCAGRRVLLTTGHTDLDAFTGGWFLVRAITRPPTLPPDGELLLRRGPFTLEGELELFRRHAIDLLVTKDSGGPAPKLEAARRLGVPVVVVQRPRPPKDVAHTVDEALARVLRARGR
jgi:precorrin-6A/cobalt-precorrin-6A reductase